MMAGDDALGEELRGLTEEVAVLRRETVRENELRAKRIAKAEEQIAGQKRLTRWAILVGAVGIVVGLVAIVGVVLSVGTQRDFHSQTTDARLGSCQQQRVSAANTIAAADDHDLTLASLLLPVERRTPELQRTVDANLLELHNSSVRKNPLRLCTPQGIADFLSGRGGYETPTTVG